jgi:hypothetical protein
MKTKTNLVLILLLTVLLTFSGCATLLAPTAKKLSLSADIENVDVIINGQYIGIAPISVNLTADREYFIEFRKDGYHTITTIVKPKVGLGWVAVDLIGGFVPVIIDAVTGRWMVLNTRSVNVYIRKAEL